MEPETLSERRNIQQRINALRRDRDVQAAYGDSVAADRLLNQIADLEGQLDQISKPADGRSAEWTAGHKWYG